MICLKKIEKGWTNYRKNKNKALLSLKALTTPPPKNKKMESIIVHPKNQMELNALKSTLKEMGIKFEKFHTRNSKTEIKPSVKKETKPKK